MGQGTRTGRHTGDGINININIGNDMHKCWSGFQHSNLRSHYSSRDKGEEQGRTGVMPRAWGHMDVTQARAGDVSRLWAPDSFVLELRVLT